MGREAAESRIIRLVRFLPASLFLTFHWSRNWVIGEKKDQISEGQIENRTKVAFEVCNSV